MKPILIYFTILALYGCGADDSVLSKEQDGEAQKSSPRQVSTPSTEAKEPIDFSEEEIQGAMLVEKKTDLHECSEKNKKQLVYIAEDDAFQSCNGKAWSAVKIKGLDGKDGVNGKDGSAGKDGAVGSVGATGAAGRDAKTLSATEWEHPITAALWFVTGSYYNQQQASSCPTGSRFASSSEWLSAFQSGITNKIGTDAYGMNQRVWIDANTYVQIYTGATAYSASGVQSARDASSGNGMLNFRAVCIKN